MTVETWIPTSFLQEIADKVQRQERVTEEEGLRLFSCNTPEEQEAIRRLADHVRKRKNGDLVHFASSLFIYPTNLCELNCPFCSFYAKPGWEKAWYLTPAQVEEKIRKHAHMELTEIHIVGGLWRDCNLDYYEELFPRIHSVDPNLHIKALTAVEYDFLAKLHGISIEEVFQKMMSWGLGSLPGGGAEILVEEIRKKIAPGKITSDEYLAIHKIAHKLGLRSNVTMLFGHIESNADIVSHLCRVRELQDETGGFQTFIPLKFGEENNALGKRKNRLKGKSLPLVYAISRLMLDNISHLKVLWNYIGIETGLEMLKWGGNDLSSTNTEEKVIEMAGGVRVQMDRKKMEELICQAGRTPLLTHSGALP
ncbi:MAG: Aminodeoxyfutalosine synthase [Chlamydiae bacterium]|nr:Aminodeoxyfutalosine synthase [Chlamydiota bacterium]